MDLGKEFKDFFLEKGLWTLVYLGNDFDLSVSVLPFLDRLIYDMFATKLS